MGNRKSVWLARLLVIRVTGFILNSEQQGRAVMPPYIAPEIGARVGVWGESTSTLDWCEENYVLSYYIAEFWNTLSNAAMILPALLGLWSCSHYGLELRYTLCYFGLLVVGVGSLLFHGTLLYTMQLLDELPMLMLSAVMLHALYEMGQPKRGHTAYTYFKASLLVVYVSIVSLVYIIVNDPTFHEVAYGIMVLGLVVHGFHSLRKYGDCQHLSIAILSFSLYVFGFILWNFDNHFCPHWRDYRSSSPLLGPLTQFHSWWHLLAGLGTYLHIVVSSRVRMEHLKHTCSLKYCLGLPYLEVLASKN